MRARKIRRSFVAVSVVATFVVGDIASIPSAGAHEFEEGVTVTLNAKPNKIRRGKRIAFFGEIQAANPECNVKRLVEIFRIGSGGTIGAVFTNENGNYGFRTKLRRGGKYVARVTSILEGVHPHRHACFGDTSDVERIRVRKRRR